MMGYKYKGMKINMNDKNGIIKLIIYMRKEGGPYYKTYYEKAVYEEFVNREKMLNYLKGYLDIKIKEIRRLGE